MTHAALGIAGVNTRPLFRGALGIAGLDRVSKASLAIAGNLSSPLRRTVGGRLLEPAKALGKRTLGDRIATRTWERCLWFPCWTYLVCTDRSGNIRWRNEREAMFGPEARQRHSELVGAPVRLYLDSSAYRRWTGEAPAWATYENYLRAIELIQPDAYMAWDTFGDAEASLRGYERMVADGYGDRCIPVWPMQATWDDRASTIVEWHINASEAVRAAISNARLAVRDPVFQYMAARSHIVAIGGMVQGPCPREVRHVYLAELCRLMPDHQFWAMGQASHVVLNGLAQYGLLDRVWLDGSWWILHAMTDQIAILQHGLIRNIDLRKTGATTFFMSSELMMCNLRSAIGAYLQEWSAPGPPEVPTEMRDIDALMDLRRRIERETQQMTLFPLIAAAEEPTGTEG